MSKDDVIDYIEAQLDDQRTIKGDDIADLACAWCGEPVQPADPEVAVWELTHEGGVDATRYYYCSDAHMSNDKLAAMQDPERDPEHPGVEVGLKDP